MEAEIKDKLRMNYKLKEGVVDKSYGIHVAELLKLPREVINTAKAIEAEYLKGK